MRGKEIKELRKAVKATEKHLVEMKVLLKQEEDSCHHI